MQQTELTCRRVHLSPLSRRDAVWALALVLVAFVVYSPTLQHGFCNLDDHLYVVRNYQLHRGLSVSLVRESLTSFSPSNWHPLTLISHAVDCSLFGLSPAGHHATNLALHSFCTCVLFLFFRRLDHNRWRPILVALLFAIHPLQVETVAWISSRKGLLSTLFALLTLWAHAEFAASRRWRFYVMALGTATLALASKSMVVTLPLLLLIVDYWPLNRWPVRSELGPVSRVTQGRRLAVLLLEKAPHALLSVGCIVLTLHAHGQERVFHDYSWPARIANVFYSYVVYLQKIVWPSGLCIYYPHSGEDFSRPWLALNVVVVFVLFCLAFKTRKSLPALTSGWLWYVVSLLPVVGLIPIDGNGWADRYAYFPIIGIFSAIVWSVPATWWLGRRRAVFAAAFIVVFALGSVTLVHVRFWRSNEALFGRALQVSQESAVAHTGYGAGQAERGNLQAAERHLRMALEIEPRFSWAGSLLGTVLLRQGRTREALFEFQQWADKTPSNLEWRSNVAQAAAQLGEIEPARAIWEGILREYPGEPSAYAGLGLLALNAGRLNEAKANFESALVTSPYYPDAWKGLGYVAIEAQRHDEALRLLQRAIDLDPSADDARFQVARVLNLTGRYPGAERILKELMARSPDSSELLGSLAWSLVMQERASEALLPLERLARIQPDDVATLHSLARVLEALNRPREAMPYLLRVAQLQPDRPHLTADLTRVQRAIENGPGDNSKTP